GKHSLLPPCAERRLRARHLLSASYAWGGVSISPSSSFDGLFRAHWRDVNAFAGGQESPATTALSIIHHPA
ncbi:MAG: hypothetical protein NTU41_08530, partial [Chloroflexi bacterium]|nr:hypothetical protein [Chloroflexota bacterium]